MVTFYNELPTQSKAAENGSLLLTHHHLSDFVGFSPKVRLFSVAELEPGQEIAFHTHQGETETYLLLSGTGLYNDNGTKVAIQAGAVTFCPSGEGHGLKNAGNEPLRFVCLIVEK